MKKRNRSDRRNFLEFVPEKSGSLTWDTDDAGLVTLHIENTGIFNRAAQKLLHKPQYTHIHLDLFGSFVWPLIDGHKNIIELGVLVNDRFGDEAAPLYERLSKFFQILESYHWITLRREPADRGPDRSAANP